MKGIDKRIDMANRDIAEIAAQLKRLPSNVGGGMPESTRVPVRLAAHGFIAGTPLKYTASGYAKAQADTEANSRVVGIVERTVGTDSFVLATGGKIWLPVTATEGTIAWLDSGTAGTVNTVQDGVWSRQLWIWGPTETRGGTSGQYVYLAAQPIYAPNTGELMTQVTLTTGTSWSIPSTATRICLLAIGANGDNGSGIAGSTIGYVASSSGGSPTAALVNAATGGGGGGGGAVFCFYDLAAMGWPTTLTYTLGTSGGGGGGAGDTSFNLTGGSITLTAGLAYGGSNATGTSGAAGGIGGYGISITSGSKQPPYVPLIGGDGGNGEYYTYVGAPPTIPSGVQGTTVFGGANGSIRIWHDG